MEQVAIVTGGGSGIGAALSRALAGRGCHVVVADIDEAAAAEVATTIDGSATGSATPVAVDVADRGAVHDLVTRTPSEHGRLDFLFNNAGIGAAVPFEELTPDHWRRTIEVNLLGVIEGSHAAFPVMREQGFGHIVNTASLAGLLGGLNVALPYTTSKHGVVGFTLGLRVEGALAGVGVHLVCPGGIDTPLIDKTEFPGLPVPDGVTAMTMREFGAAAGVNRYYPADRFAADVLDGVARDRAIIVAPASARLAWRMWRAAPGLMLMGSVAGGRRLRRKLA